MKQRSWVNSLVNLLIKFKTKNSIGRTCIIFGGETTVNVLGKGKGGRNMEMALSFSREIKNKIGISALFAGSDGIDGAPSQLERIAIIKPIVKQMKKV